MCPTPKFKLTHHPTGAQGNEDDEFPCEPVLAQAKGARPDKQAQGESGVTIVIGQRLI